MMTDNAHAPRGEIECPHCHATGNQLQEMRPHVERDSEDVVTITLVCKRCKDLLSIGGDDD